MLTVLVPLLAALTASSPVPLQSAPPSPLKEIGRVQSLSICSAIVVHANSAIGAALDNDQQLVLVINRLRTTDLDAPNEITRRNGASDLSTLAGRIRIAAAAGLGEIKRLRAMAAETTEPNRKAELKAFTDSLGGALARQRKAGTDLDKMLVIIDGRRAVEEVNAPELVNERSAVAGPADRSGAVQRGGIMRSAVAAPQPEPVDPILQNVAQDFDSRTESIRSDEGIAADHALGATTGC